MIDAIYIRNFQSWAEVSMDLAPITMIVGKGNSGKSAIFRALSYALTNQGGDAFIREGADRCEVAVSMNDHVLIWRKQRGRGAVYTVDGKEYHKTGQTTPTEIAEAFGVRGIEIDKNFTLWPQLHDQFDLPAVVFESGSRVARIIGKFTHLDVLVQAQILARRDLEAGKRQLQAARETADEKLAELDELPDIEALRARYDALAQRADDTLTAERRADDAEAALQAYRQSAAALAHDPSPLVPRVTALRDAFGDVAAAEAALGQCRDALAAYADAGVSLDAATERQQELTARYEAHCAEHGVCEGCPWK